MVRYAIQMLNTVNLNNAWDANYLTGANAPGYKRHTLSFGKTIERWRRKASGLRDMSPTIAGPPDTHSCICTYDTQSRVLSAGGRASIGSV